MKKCTRVLSGILAIVVMNACCNIRKVSYEALAEDKVSSMRKQIDELERQQKDLSSKLTGLKNDMANKKVYRTTLLEQMNALQSQINVEVEKIEILNQEMTEKQNSVTEINQKIRENMTALGERLKAIYKAGDVPELAIFLNVKSFDDFIDKADMIQKLSKYDADLIEALKNNLEEVRQSEAIIEKNKSEVEAAKAILDGKRLEIESLQQENDRIIKELQNEEANIRSKISSTEARKRSLQSKISNSNRAGVSRDGYLKGKYIWPVPGHGGISSGWGDGRRHNGIDIPAPKGTRVVAAADGVVVGINRTNRWGSGWGYYVKISHGSGYETIYAHLSQVSVEVGQHLKSGEKIGEIGSTGRSTGNHLHFGTSKNGKWYNPKQEV